MAVAFSDSHPNLYMVSPTGTGKALHCLAHEEQAWLFHEPHTGLEDCLNMLLPCFRKRMSGSVAAVSRGRRNDFVESEYPQEIINFLKCHFLLRIASRSFARMHKRKTSQPPRLTALSIVRLCEVRNHTILQSNLVKSPSLREEKGT